MENFDLQLFAEAGDVVNARGYGKFRISGEPHATRKGKLAIEAEVYP